MFHFPSQSHYLVELLTIRNVSSPGLVFCTEIHKRGTGQNSSLALGPMMKIGYSRWIRHGRNLRKHIILVCCMLNSMKLSANSTGNFIPAIIGAGMYIFGTGQACIFYVQGIRPHYFTVLFIVMQ